LWDKRGSPTVPEPVQRSPTGTPTRGHALAHWASAEGTRSSTAQQGGRRERRWRRDADKQGVSSVLVLGVGKALGKM
jgi:hypothetical protein